MTGDPTDSRAGRAARRGRAARAPAAPLQVQPHICCVAVLSDDQARACVLVTFEPRHDPAGAAQGALLKPAT